jgi:hypothetical protein
VDGLQVSRVVAFGRDASPTRMDLVSSRTAAAGQGKHRKLGVCDRWQMILKSAALLADDGHIALRIAG